MTSRPLVFLGIIIIIIAGIAAAGYVLNGRNALPNDASSDSTGTTTEATTSSTFYNATSTSSATGSSTADNGSSTSTLAYSVPVPDPKAIDTTAWLINVDNKNGFSIEYPSNLTLNTDGSFSFPKNLYYHWPLLDDSKVTISTAPKCPVLTADGGRAGVPVQFSLNGNKFAQSIGTDVGAGQLYTEIAYDTTMNGSCYHIDFLDHGTNGAGFYVDDNSLIKKYDDQHTADMAAVIAILNGMVSTFHVLAAGH